ncbi:aminoglycoside phosphotransferase (APT) family kinase protein [Clavibacter michiganensis]|uniref:aminoglycoside phosphotransferase family protein n=1 Tax=Clavibacter michiganensis TaxID=28447 RepID=UPI001D3446C0|nr:aminoglycoside phosphotransferase family protein [Clavibacter michiganensis]MBP2456948.1 aminoglycoside phosphotransferase (APT) family kinase protein [Clavibacter michiganensis]MDQ0409518.1 aminoglycoside phosphotransferase (APT) family kinase protein [Clavibacter michiganensis]
MRMHDGQVDVDERTVRRLLDAQLPALRDEPIRRVPDASTVNAVFRVGARLAARLPLVAAEPEAARDGILREHAAMRELAARCPVPTPAPVAVGRPGHGYPMPWAVQTWVPGAVATPGGLASSPAFARDLGRLVRALRSGPTDGRRVEGGGRGGDLRAHDAWMAECLDASVGILPVDRLRAMWARFRELPAGGPDVMSHTDLIPANLLVDGGRLAGVLDGGGFQPADPALDLVAAWHLLDGPARAVLRAELGSDDVEWQRGAAWAFEQAMGLAWYYRGSLPSMSALGRSTLARLLADPATAA